jgi:hypothetical protein
MSYLRRVAFLSLVLLGSACGGGDDGSAIPDADPTAPDVEVGSLPYLADCDPTHAEECESGLCFTFNTHGPHCTTPCSVPTDCPAPSSGCSGMGVCKGDW